MFESAGIATVTLAATRSVAERMHPPRALYGDFPLGRPLGKPADPAFQHDVLARAFALLDTDTGPVLEGPPGVDHGRRGADGVLVAAPVRPRPPTGRR